MLKLKGNINKNIMGWVAAIIVVFAICSPVTGTVASMLIMSQKVNSIVSIVLSVSSGIIIAYYTPVMLNYFRELLKLFLK